MLPHCGWFARKRACGCPHPNPQNITVAATPTTQLRRFLVLHHTLMIFSALSCALHKKPI